MTSSRKKEADDDGKEQLDFSETRAVQIDCVLRTIAESIQKIKISLILPRILERAEDLPGLLKDTPYESVLPLVHKFMKRRNRLVLNMSTPLLDHRLVRMIDYFQENYKMYELFPPKIRLFTQEERKLLTAFEMLYDIASQHLRKTARAGLAKERELHHMYHENEAIKSTIIEMKEKLYRQKVNLRWRMAGRRAFLQKFEDDLAAKKWQNSLRIQNEITKCTRDIRSNHRITIEKQKELEEELEKTKLEYEKTVKMNLKQEQEARDEKNKLLMQLQGLLKKYDQTIGEKMSENLAMQEEYDKAKKKIDDFMVIYRQEEAIYIEIVLKREEEERRQQQRRVILFMMNRAARVIQRYWRAWRKWQRKKAKKLGGGKRKKK